jgi:hypothetical protein
MAHASLGLTGGLLLVILALQHDIPKSSMKKLIIFGSLGLILEIAIVKFALIGIEKMPEEIQLKSILYNIHFWFPFLFKGLFIRQLVITIAFFAITYFLSRSQKLKKDLLICFSFIASSVILFFLFATFKNLTGLRLCIMRCSTLLFILGLVNLASVDFDKASLKDKILLVFLIFLMLHQKNYAGNFFPYSFYDPHGMKIIFMFIIYFLVIIIFRLNFRKSTILFLLIPFLVSPVLYALEKNRYGRSLVKMFNYISANVPKGSVFLEWGGASDIAAGSRFRLYSKSQIVNPMFLGETDYTGSKKLLDDEIRKVECVMGRKIGADEIYDWQKVVGELREKLKLPLNEEQLFSFKEKYDVKYVIYPSGFKKPAFEYTLFYSGAGYNILKL